MRAAATCRVLMVVILSQVWVGQVLAQKTLSGTRPQRRSGITAGASLGLAVGRFEPDAANAGNVREYGIGFDMRVSLWLRPFLGLRAGAGVEGFNGPPGPNGHDAGGSYGIADVALALRTPPPRSGFTFGLDIGAATVFEPAYSYSYTSDNVNYIYPSIDLPLRSGPYVEPSIRRGGLVGWQVSYRHFFATATASEGRMKSRVVVALSVAR